MSVRRDKIAIVHPITGELLGELDEEVATGRVVEVRDKFSVVEVQKAAAGAQVQVKDRVDPIVIALAQAMRLHDTLCLEVWSSSGHNAFPVITARYSLTSGSPLPVRKELSTSPFE